MNGDKNQSLPPVILIHGFFKAKIDQIISSQQAQDIDFDSCQIRINMGKGSKDRIVPFPISFRETLMLYWTNEKTSGAIYLFESNRKKAFTTRGVRKILANYTKKAAMARSLSPHNNSLILDMNLGNR